MGSSYSVRKREICNEIGSIKRGPFVQERHVTSHVTAMGSLANPMRGRNRPIGGARKKELMKSG